ncbi:uncharacterized protein LOC135131139 isoform X2 [Zophobas morio]|uniref:uncharacterized protein LOC135131139 isoform X2 n=1 Tax=Zophobas morio TaxID=2755281 RepID=UPI003082AA90
MKTERKPRRLLCSWHVIKNWNIQGRSKLKKQENRLKMKKEMRNILKETKVEKFIELKENYFNHLMEENEFSFLNYLKNITFRNYFQNEDRIMMWAHCFRINVGINTNMAIESLNKVLKHNKMKGNRNIRIEKLLDMLEELVNEKMWKKILNTERPNANNYQHKVTAEAHKKAENMTNCVDTIEFGKFRVKSSTGKHFYCVSYNLICDKDCRSMYCNECKVCFHRYKCECPEFSVKTAVCKHIHAVVLYERRVHGSVLDTVNTGTGEPSNANEYTKNKYQDDLNLFLEEQMSEGNNPIDFERQKKIELDEVVNYTMKLDKGSFEKFMNMFRNFKNNLEGAETTEVLNKKRKIEKQTYYPNRK